MKNSTFEQAVEVVKALPSEERERFDKWFKQQEQIDTTPKSLRVSEDNIVRFKKTQDWLAKNREQFMGQWVCLEGDQLIAHGTDGLKVHAEAKAAGIEIPFLEHIVEEKEPFYAGW